MHLFVDKKVSKSVLKSTCIPLGLDHTLSRIILHVAITVKVCEILVPQWVLIELLFFLESSVLNRSIELSVDVDIVSSVPLTYILQQDKNCEV